MQNFVGFIQNINSKVNSVVWGPPMLILMLLTGLYLTCGTGFFQIRRFHHTIKNTIAAIFKDREVTKTKDEKAISQFQALATALAATVGTGNIVGVATAIASGGAGAVFWMWISALLGMMTSFSENVLGIYFRRKNEKGEWAGGPMYYIEKGLGQKWLAVVFSVFCLFASFGIGSVAQVNGISTALKGSFNIPGFVTGTVVCVLIAVIILGGLKRIVTVTEKFVPFMAAFYIIGALIIITVNFRRVGDAFGEIFSGAFSMRSVGGGVMGYGISRAMRFGVARGVFSNEAGLGSSVMVHSSSDVREPVQQGMWGIFQVFFDTVVVCSMTAAVVLTSGKIDLSTGCALAGTDDATLVAYAFGKQFGFLGEAFVATAVLLFAFTTVIGWSQYGSRAVEYLFGVYAASVYRRFFVAVTVLGALMTSSLAWDISDTFNGLMMIPNLIGVVSLCPLVRKITKNYITRRIHGITQRPLLSADPEIQRITALEVENEYLK